MNTILTKSTHCPERFRHLDGLALDHDDLPEDQLPKDLHPGGFKLLDVHGTGLMSVNSCQEDHCFAREKDRRDVR